MDSSLKNFEILHLRNEKFVKPFTLRFEIDGQARFWDCVKVHDSVSILIFNEESKNFVLVRQFRPSVWYYENTHENSDKSGYTYELCAGIMDKNLSAKQTAIEEIFEETGYKVNDLEFITTCYSALGFGANRQDFFYAAVKNSDKIAQGGGVDGEKIEIINLPLNKAENFAFDDNFIKAPGLVMCFLWFFKKHKNFK
ncbi:NUDIX domain-containing protein [Campylobacter hominis]